MQTETAVVQYEREKLPIKTMSDLADMGNLLAQSGMFGVCSPGKGATIAAIVIQEGMSLLEFKRSFHVTDRGDVTMRADRMLAEYRKRGGEVTWLEFSDTKAEAIWSYRENEGVTISYTIEEAQRAGLVRPKSAWTSHPDAMLRARLTSKAIRMLCPEAVAGMYTPEEAEDMAHNEPDRSGPPRPINKPPTHAPASEHIIDAEVMPATHPIDYNICPCGRNKGTAWTTWSLEHLQMALEVEHPDMEPGHRDAVRAAIEAKKGQGNE